MCIRDSIVHLDKDLRIAGHRRFDLLDSSLSLALNDQCVGLVGNLRRHGGNRKYTAVYIIVVCAPSKSEAGDYHRRHYVHAMSERTRIIDLRLGVLVRHVAIARDQVLGTVSSVA